MYRGWELGALPWGGVGGEGRAAACQHAPLVPLPLSSFILKQNFTFTRTRTCESPKPLLRNSGSVSLIQDLPHSRLPGLSPGWWGERRVLGALPPATLGRLRSVVLFLSLGFPQLSQEQSPQPRLPQPQVQGQTRRQEGAFGNVEALGGGGRRGPEHPGAPASPMGLQ